MPELPFATIVIPVRNEARTIRGTLESVLVQDYPHDRYEILVLDGESSDDTRAIVEGVAAGSPAAIRVLDNPGRSVPAALNVALREARGDYLVRVDGHSHLSPGYIRRSIEANVEHDADLAGGWVRAVGDGPVGRAVAAAFASPFSMGNPGSWNRPTEPREVVSVPCGSYRIEALRGIGGFDEGQIANQDYEANFRLRAAGGKAVLLPDVWFDYQPRSTLPALGRQFFRYGFYKARTMAKHPASVRPRHVVPVAGLAVGALIVAAAPASETARRTLVAGGALYAAGLAAASASAGRRLGRDAVLLPAVFATMHAAWAAGNAAGLARFWPRRRELRG